MNRSSEVVTAVVDSVDTNASTANRASVLRYPFCEMQMRWLEDYVRMTPSARRAHVVVRVMDCLMAHAVLHEDPFLEEGVMQINKMLPKLRLQHVAHEGYNNFEISHHIFKTICVAAKFPNLEAQAKRGLLVMVESRIKEIDKAAYEPAINLDVSVSEVARKVLGQLQVLRKDVESRTAFADFMTALKTLFFSVSLHNGVVPKFGLDSSPFDTFVCCDGCPCYSKLHTTHTIFLRDIEKAKVIDCVMIAAVKEEDTIMHEIASELLSNHFKDYMENPYLDDIGRLIQNGIFFFCRTALFDALNLIHHLMQLHEDLSQAPKEGSNLLERVSLSFLWVKEEVKNIKDLRELTPLLNLALRTIESTQFRLGRIDCKQDLHTLKNYAIAVFAVLSGSEYHLAVHSRDVFVGKPADMKCANPACPDTAKDLLKCSGCDVTYYCSAECQKVDWEQHKAFCHEIESRRARVNTIPCEVGPLKRVRSAI